MELLKVENLVVEVDEKRILDGVSLIINEGETHVLMGKNGSGKSTLMQTIMGNPVYNIVSGKIYFKGQDITEMEVDKRAKLGIFLSFQNPEEIHGIKVSEFLRFAKSKVSNENISSINFAMRLNKKTKELNIPHDMPSRYVNVGFSGGEKKKSEILQLGMLDPSFAMLDEIDSGLDVDAIKDVEKEIVRFLNPSKGLILITHHTSMTNTIVPDFVHILKGGKIVKSGDKTLIDEIQKNGYELGIENEEKN